MQETLKPPVPKELKSDSRDKPITPIVLIAIEEIETKHYKTSEWRGFLENLLKETITWSGSWIMGRILTGVNQLGDVF